MTLTEIELLTKYCKRQPVDKLVTFEAIKRIIRLDPLATRQGRAVLRVTIKELLEDGYVFLLKPGAGIYRSNRLSAALTSIGFSPDTRMGR
jgi:hypothetical protein